MKIYSFANISARKYPTVKLLDYPYFWRGVQFCLNVSEKPYSPELEVAMAAHGIEWDWCPVSEIKGAQWWDSIEKGLQVLYAARKAGKKIVVHCDCGNNRSRTFVEAFYYMITYEQLVDVYKGEINHLAYNCKIGHLPPMEELESRIRVLWFDLYEDKARASIKRMFFHSIRNNLCGTPFVKALIKAVDDYKNGRPVDEGITVDDVYMTIYDEWASFVSTWGQDGKWKEIYAPYYSIDGIDEKRHLKEPDSIVGFIPERGYEYRLRVRRIFLTNKPDYVHYELIEVLGEWRNH